MSKLVTVAKWMVAASVLIWVGANTGTALAATVYVSKAGNDANDGQSWATAKLTVQAGLNAAVSGDQVWVAAGTYVERITLVEGITLYGGFAGNETDLSQRNFVAGQTTTNQTILDGNFGRQRGDFTAWRHQRYPHRRFHHHKRNGNVGRRPATWRWNLLFLLLADDLQ